MTRAVCLSLLVLGGCASTPGGDHEVRSGSESSDSDNGQDPAAEPSVSLPEPDALFERSLEVAGGRDKLLSVEGYRLRGRFESQQGLVGRYEMLMRAPNLMRSTIILPQGVAIEEGYDGRIAWTRDPAQGSRLKEGQELAQATRFAEIHREANYQEHYPKRRVIAKEQFLEQEVWHVEARTSDGQVDHIYFSVEDGRRVGLRMDLYSALATLPTEIHFGDFERFDGLEIPTRVTSRVLTLEQTVVIEEVLFEVPEEEAFAAPDEIEALLEEATVIEE